MRLLLVFFFVSSTRRHTSLVSDWSSDVCSSDLTCASSRRCGPFPARPATPGVDRNDETMRKCIDVCRRCARSEERRVGKEEKKRELQEDERRKRIEVK